MRIAFICCAFHLAIFLCSVILKYVNHNIPPGKGSADLCASTFARLQDGFPSVCLATLHLFEDAFLAFCDQSAHRRVLARQTVEAHVLTDFSLRFAANGTPAYGDCGNAHCFPANSTALSYNVSADGDTAWNQNKLTVKWNLC